MTYGGTSLPSFTATIAGFVNSQVLATSGVTGSAGLTTAATGYDGSTAGSASVVGDYTITAAVGTLTASNYQFSYTNGLLSVGKANLTITASNDSKVYGATTTAASIAYSSGVAAGVSTGYTTSGLVNGDTISSVTLSSTGAAATATVAGGPYTITPSALSGSTRTTADNYTITYSNAATGLTVNKATLTVTADAKSMTYGGTSLPSFTATIAGFVNSQDLSTSGVTGSAGLTTTATAYDGSTAGSASVVGDYTITAAVGTLTASNYQFSYTNGTLTVDKANLSITATNDSKVYGATTTAASIAYSSGVAAGVSTGYTTTGLVNGDTISNVTLTSTGATATATVAGGPYTITPSALSGSTRTTADNYTITYSNAATGLTVNKATLTVTAADQVRVYGDANPSLTYGISGYVNGQDLSTSGVTGTPTACRGQDDYGQPRCG
jgi:hypothetical protein